MKPQLTFPILQAPSLSNSSSSTKKRSWDAMKSLERMLHGYTQPDISLAFSQNFPEMMPRLPPIFGEMQISTPAAATSSMPLFEALIGDPRSLLRDYIERPEDYAHELLPVLLALIHKNKTIADLTP